MSNPAMGFLENIKRAAIEAYHSSMPTGIYFGTVISVSPLKISVEQKITLTEKQLILTSSVTDYDLEMIVDHQTEDESGGNGEDSFSTHRHDYTGTKTFRVHNALTIGEKVIMIREQGGQRFVVLDKVREVVS